MSNSDISFENPNCLRGGWFVGPEEYESMGYTLGLPPGFYAPDLPEIHELVEKIRPLNGIILPSTIQSQQPQKQSKKKILVTNLPLDCTSEQLDSFLTSSLLKRKLITDEHPIEKIDIFQNKLNAHVEFKSQKDAEAAIQIGKTLVFNKRELRIFWLRDSTDISQRETIETDKYDRNAVFAEFESNEDMPTEKEISEAFEAEGFQVMKVSCPKGFKHAIINLVNPSLADAAVFKFNNTAIKGKLVRVKKCFIGDNEGPASIPEKEKRRIKVTNGPTSLISVINPLILDQPSISDILNPDVTASAIVQPETERIQPPPGSVLHIYNIAKEMIMYDPDLLDEFVQDISSECQKYGEIADIKVEHLPIRSDYAVVKVFFKSPENAKDAQMSLSGRRYAGRLVITSLESE